MIGNAQTSVEREQYVQKIMSLLNLPAIQTIVQRPEFPAMEFFKWVLNEVNFRQINSLLDAVTFDDKIVKQGQAMGVKPNNMNGFVSDMKSSMLGAVPEFANMLQQQQASGDIPNPEDVTRTLQ